MSGWHREHPELAGTDADPAMANEGHRKAFEELVARGLVEPPEGFHGTLTPCEDGLVLDREDDR